MSFVGPEKLWGGTEQSKKGQWKVGQEDIPPPVFGFGGWDTAQQLRALSAFCRGSEFYSHHPHGDLKQFINSTSRGSSTAFSMAPGMIYIHINGQNNRTHKIKHKVSKMFLKRILCLTFLGVKGLWSGLYFFPFPHFLVVGNQAEVCL